ncbi:hypothetical protein BHM03_00048873 [Ensete ventricosum]|nr:hypothetical protein BHM03_00048873 [Ensete ventricosum]
MLAEGIESLLGVYWELVEGDRELARMASGVRWKKTKRLTERSLGVLEKLTGTILDMQDHPNSNLAIHEVINTSGVNENGDWLLFKKSSHFHRLRCVKGIKSLPGWHKGVRQKKTETRRKIIGGRRKACRETNYNRSNGVTTRLWAKIKLGHRAGFGRCNGISSKFARRFVEGIGKLAGNTLGDCRKKTRRLTARIPEDAGLVGGQRVNRPYPGVRAAEPPKSAGKPPVPSFSDYI